MSVQKQLDYDVIRKYCGQELSVRLQGAVNSQADSVVKIVNTGMVSSGKSSLYNVLTGNTREERFPTGAARTTVCADTCEYKGMLFVDTPGIDVRDADDETAFQTIMEADMILIVHNIKTGPLTRAETEWMKRIAGGMKDSGMRRRRMIFVCTWKDAREKETGYGTIIEEVKRQAFEIVGIEIPFFTVSVRKYLAGIERDKPVLCEKSGIPELSDFLESSAAEYAEYKQQDSRTTLQTAAEGVLKKLGEARNKRTVAVKKNRDALAQRFHLRRSSWNNVFGYFQERRRNLDRIKKDVGED